MSNLPFTLRQLEVFAQLAETRSFRAAAERLGISQASVSNQLRTLEEQLGVRLFSRRPGKKPVLTGDGHLFLDDLAQFNAAARKLAGHRRQVPSDLGPVVYRVSAGQGLMDYYIRQKLDSFLAANPTIELEFDTQPPDMKRAIDLPASRFDFALLHVREDAPAIGDVRCLAHVAGGIYGHRKFAAGHELPLSAQRMNELPFILPRAGGPQEARVLQGLEQRGIVPRQVVVHTQYFDVIAAMMERGLGVASFSAAILPPGMRDDIVRLHPLVDWRLVVYARPDDGDPRRKAVEEFLISCVLLDPAYPTLSIEDPRWRAARERIEG